MDSNIILALDIEDENEAIRIAKEVEGYVYAFKVGYPLILNCGKEIIGKVSEVGNVIVDIKIADIPDVSRKIANTLTLAGASGIIVHGIVGRDVLREVRKESKEMYVVAEMSHPGSLDFMSEQSERIAMMAREEAADGIVAPATRPERIRVLKRLSGLKVLSPGVGTQGGSFKEAITSGADYIIIGRSIFLSADPKQKIKELLSQR